MKSTVVVTNQAADDVEGIVSWWATERSAAQASRWQEGILGAFGSLSQHPERCPFAPEHSRFHYELREIHFGIGRRATHRVVFTIVGECVVILTVRHVARDAISPDDIVFTP